LPSQANKTNQDREGEALKSICQILNLVSRYYTVIICFDEIDTLNNCDEAGNKTEEIIVNLVKRLYDSIQQSAASKGICFLTVMFLDTWQEIVKAFGKSQSLIDRLVGPKSQILIDRLVGPGKKPIQLEYLDGDSIIELVQCWHQMAIINPETLEKLVQLQAKYPHSIDLWQLKSYLQPAPTSNEEVVKYLEMVEEKIRVRSHVVELVRKYLASTNSSTVGIEQLYGAYVTSGAPQSLTQEELSEIMIELSSPLTGYLGREGTSFYFLRKLYEPQMNTDERR